MNIKLNKRAIHLSAVGTKYRCQHNHLPPFFKHGAVPGRIRFRYDHNR